MASSATRTVGLGHRRPAADGPRSAGARRLHGLARARGASPPGSLRFVVPMPVAGRRSSSSRALAVVSVLIGRRMLSGAPPARAAKPRSTIARASSIGRIFMLEEPIERGPRPRAGRRHRLARRRAGPAAPARRCAWSGVDGIAAEGRGRLKPPGASGGADPQQVDDVHEADGPVVLDDEQRRDLAASRRSRAPRRRSVSGATVRRARGHHLVDRRTSRSAAMWRRRSPSVTMPASVPRRPTTPTQPKPLARHFRDRSDIGVPGATSGRPLAAVHDVAHLLQLRAELAAGVEHLEIWRVKPRPPAARPPAHRRARAASWSRSSAPGRSGRPPSRRGQASAQMSACAAERAFAVRGDGDQRHAETAANRRRCRRVPPSRPTTTARGSRRRAWIMPRSPWLASPGWTK